MAATKTEYYFYPGRNGKTGNSGPCILVVDGKYKFRVNQVNKDKSVFEMYCQQQGNPEFSCKAKATIDKSDNGSFLSSGSELLGVVMSVCLSICRSVCLSVRLSVSPWKILTIFVSK